MSDNDGDLIATFSNKTFLKGVQEGLPITYEKKSASKSLITDTILQESDLQGFGSKIGYITNVSSTMYVQCDNWDKDTPEYKELYKRLKLCRKLQGNAIDAGKGIITKGFPEHWVKVQRYEEGMEDSEKELIDFQNSILVDKRPVFFRWLYPHYLRKYRSELEAYENYSMTKFGVHFSDLVAQTEKNLDQQKLIDNYYRYSFFLHNDSIMNYLSRYMQKSLENLRMEYTGVDGFDYSMYLSKSVEFTEEDIDKMEKLYLDYANHKKYKDHDSANYLAIIKKKALDISSDERKLASLAVKVCYEIYPKGRKGFVWECFPDGLIRNVWYNKDEKAFDVPVANTQGEIEYLWKRYSIIKLEVDLFGNNFRN